MYEESKKRLNWVTMLLKIILVILLLVLSLKVLIIIRDKKNDRNIKNEYDAKLELVDNYAKAYFKNNIPVKTGEAKVIYLDNLVNDKVIDDIDKCDMKKSYIKVVRLDKEYEIKSYLKCDEYENSLSSFIELPITSTTTTNKTTTTKVTSSTKKKTTQVTTTTKANQVTKKVKVSFNSNGGNVVESQVLDKNTNIKAMPVPTRDGYKFIGWYYHGDEFKVDSLITNDIVLVAKWIKE